MKRLILPLIAALAGIVSLPSAQALTAYAITQGNRLLTFDTATPGTLTGNVSISGIDAAYSVVGIALRTTKQTGGSGSVGTLWGIAYNMIAPAGQEFFLCTIIPSTGVATKAGGFLAMDDTANADGFGFGFDPAADRFRFISVQTNYSINPNTQTATQQTSFAGFPAQGGAAFTSSPYTGGTSPFYNISVDVTPRELKTSTDISKGTLTTVGPVSGLGSFFRPFGLTFGGSTLYLAVNDNLYTVNSSTGTPTLVAPIEGAPTVRGLAIIPASLPPKLAISVKISGPKSGTTTAASKLIKGTVTSNGGVSKVEYRLGTKGKFKKASGTSKWKFTAKLKPGQNQIFVRATTGTSTSKLAKVTVTRN